ncbi:hypothetical protein BDA99DRAFT_561956 [Phascolomyces articulosus]|uniref:Uncharacterized protein n=1 Tax=Phascolomyces articulosus TaxID=60185 RepID=A0AAD5PBZ9_9FUNG|nr:hypothetical protein BDA99DRAFT_561956 [Phascolomyces articulosus]
MYTLPRTFLIFTALIIPLSVLPHYAHSYCIYNKMEDDTRFYIRQIGGQRGTVFSHFRRDKLFPGEEACCPYTKKQCAKEQTPDSEMTFWMSHAQGNYRDLVGFEITCPAGGYIIFNRSYLHPKFEVYNADHTPYEFRLEHRYHNSFN